MECFGPITNGVDAELLLAEEGGDCLRPRINSMGLMSHTGLGWEGRGAKGCIHSVFLAH